MTPAPSRLCRLDLECMAQPRSRRDLSFDPPQKRIARLEATVPVFLAMAREAIRDTVAQQRTAQAALVARLAGDKVKQGKADYGPLARRHRGDIELEDRVDISSDAEFKPTIRAARRADPLRQVLKIKNVHRPHDGTKPDNARRWIAAQTYRNLIEISQGASITDRPMERVDRSAPSTGPSDMMLDCMGIVTSSRAAMGAAYPAVRWVVEEYSGLDELAVVIQTDLSDAEAVLLRGLDALVERLASYHGVATA